MFDTIIIGSGPAGVAAAIYAIRREMKILVIGKEMGGQLAWAGEIENYPGIESIPSYELIEKFRAHLKSAGIENITAEVKRIDKLDDGNFKVHTNKEEYLTKTIIIGMGLTPRRLAIKGEEKLNGRGVSYCANCDGPLFKNKNIAVVGGGNAAVDAAEVLSKIGSKVYLIHRSEAFKAFDVLINEVKERENIELLLNTEIKEIVGENKVEKVKLFNIKTDTETELDIDGVFIEVGRIAHTDLVGDLIERDQWNQIIVDEKCRTNVDGIFAAGDVTQVEFKQITVAMGQGTIAALTAYQYLQQKEGKEIKKVFDRSIK